MDPAKAPSTSPNAKTSAASNAKLSSAPSATPSAPPRAKPSTASATGTLDELDALIVTCHACPRLVLWREEVAIKKRAAYADQIYWGKPVPGFGAHDAKMLIVGLAPAAHGANRTGRLFTGDPSGDFLFAAMYRVGLCNQPSSTNIDDGLELFEVRMSAPVKCAPPENIPTTTERNNCSPYLAQELKLLSKTLRVIFVLGGFGWQALLNVLRQDGWNLPRPAPRFSHGSTASLTHPDGRALTIIGCYHVSPHNTFTGRLTEQMLDDALRQAKTTAEIG